MMNKSPEKTTQKGDVFHSIVLNSSHVIRYKKGKVHMNGEFMAHFETEEGKFYFCNCEYRKNGIYIHTKVEITKESFDKM